MHNRIFAKIKQLVGEGEHVFFVCGESKYIQDLFYTDGELLPIRKSLISSFKEHEGVNHILQIYYEDGKIHLESSKVLMRNTKIKDELGEYGSKNRQASLEVYDDPAALINHIKELNLKELKNGKWLVVFDDFHQIAKTYKGFDNQEISRFFSEVILSWKKIHNNYYVFILGDKNLGWLEDFGISTDSVIEVAEPTVHELARTAVLIAKRHDKTLLYPLTFASKYVETPKPLRVILREIEKKITETRDTGTNTFRNEGDDLKLDDVKLESGVREKIREIFNRFKEGKSVTNGIIFHGPPGTGKTTIAKALANEAGAFFLKTSASDFKGEFLGQSGQNTRRIFEKLKNNKPAVLFIDEADAILASREGKSIRDTYSDEIVNEFLAYVDGLKADREIFVVIATNYLERLDRAVISRFEEIKIDLPKGKALKEIVKEYLGKEFEQDYEVFYGLSGRDISQLGKQWREGIISGKKELLQKIKMERLSGLYPKEPELSFSDLCGYYKQKEYVTKLFKKGIKKVAVFGKLKAGKTSFIEAIAGEFGLTIIRKLPDNPVRLHGIEDKILLHVGEEISLYPPSDKFPEDIAIAVEVSGTSEEILESLRLLGFIDIELRLDEETVKEFSRKKFNFDLTQEDIKKLVNKSFPYVENYLMAKRD